MSVGLGKLNRPGMMTSIKSGSGISRKAVANNLSNGSVSGNFTLKTGNRTNWVAGQNVTKGTGKYDYQGVRQRANGGGHVRNVGLSSLAGPGPAAKATSTTTVSNGDNAFMIGKTVAGVGIAAAKMLDQMGVINLSGIGGGSSSSKPQSASSKLDNAMDAFNKPSVTPGQSGSYISDMQNCNSKDGLEVSIQNATKYKEGIDSSLSQLQGQYNQNKAQIPTLEAGVKSAEGQVSNANQMVASADQASKSAEIGVQQGNEKVNTAKSNYSQALQNKTGMSKAYADAKANTASAEQTLANTPQTITTTNPDGTTSTQPNPDYAKAQQAVQAAKTAEAEAAKKSGEADKQFELANDSVKTAESNLKDAQTQLDSANKKKADADKQLKLAQERKDTAQQKLDDAKSKLSSSQDMIQNFQEMQKESSALGGAIQEQTSRLSSMSSGSSE